MPRSERVRTPARRFRAASLALDDSPFVGVRLFFTYLWRELRRRMRQAIFIAIGLALGIGLVITVTAASTGVKNAQASVLHSL